MTDQVDAQDQAEIETATPRKAIPIVGVGSSAGGLEAIRELASALQPNYGCAYVLVQHMSPQHKSLMTHLIASETTLNVVDVENDMVPEPDIIYVTPPRYDVVINKGRLLLVEPSNQPGKPKPSVDRFLISLANELGERSTAVILSGTGSDGAYGVQAVREAGGITIAQDDSSAKYDGMPNAAIETGCVDLVLRPSQIGTQLKSIMASPRSLEQFREGDDMQGPTATVLQILLARTGVDFREYKQATVQRRMERRMTALGIKTIEEYVSYCRNHPPEVDALLKDMLISVTRFFRDKEQFLGLTDAMSEMVEKNEQQSLRIWVAGCATGEEAYSIAIMLAEAMGGPNALARSGTQIFATDIDRAALEYARRGQYSQGALYDVPQELVETYFIQQSDGVRVIEALRSVILFSDHNLCQDPPFLNMDLICCRNVLIYFGSKLQGRVLSRLHYALKQDAHLFLGTAENISGSDALFHSASDQVRLFRKRMLARKQPIEPHTFSGNWSSRTPLAATPARKPELKTDQSVERMMFDGLARSLGDNAILVSEDHSFLRIYGEVAPYVDLSEGVELDLKLALLKSPFREEARSLVTLAIRHQDKRVGGRHPVGDNEMVRLEAIPIKARQTEEKLALLTINRWEKTDFDEADANAAPTNELSSEHLRELDLELATAREALQQTIEELETSNEELQALNEELQSTNEELQATNEELETSNEELQSTNEELITVNEELQVNSSELTALNAELGSVLGNIPIPLLVLDNALQIGRASRAAVEMFDIPVPINSPHLSQVSLPDGFPRLVDVCNRALHFGDAIELDFESENKLYRLQCMPFSGDMGQLLGVTLIIVSSATADSLATEMGAILDHAPLHLIRFGENNKIQRLSAKTAESLGIEQSDAIGMNLQTILNLRDGSKDKDDSKLMEIVSGAVDQANVAVTSDDGGKRWIAAERFSYVDPITEETSVFIVGSDITNLIEERESSRIHLQSLNLMDAEQHIGYWRIDLEDQKLHWSNRVYDIHGLDPREHEPDLQSAIDLYHPDDREMVADLVHKAIETSRGYDFIARLIRGDGETAWVEARAQIGYDEGGAPAHVVGLFRSLDDIQNVKDLKTQTKLADGTAPFGFFSLEIEDGRMFWSDAVYGILKYETKEKKASLVHLIDCFGKKERKIVQKAFDTAATKGEPFGIDSTLHRADATTAPCRISVQASTTPDGEKITHLYGILSLYEDDQ
ncbi:chemotaxis protein CheB [Litoreibacter roseus]|uniref:protein-glutamate O-methyltransferase n=1 Tax=Litoreibacter roseus TaxID=2601869 RepID=A0A6N6JG90_9RHOB|nr:chemotaxis protein CheB [Litoreibacter roseus]GFE65246.1 hypothetical protein KIN_23200 [Litoreibacter roseus]